MTHRVAAGLCLAALAAAAGCGLQVRTSGGWKVSRGGAGSDSDAKVRPISGPPALAIFKPAIAPNLAKTVKADRLEAMWRSQFEGDGRFTIVSQAKVDKAVRQEDRGRYDSRVLGDSPRITLRVTAGKKTGIDRKTGKVVDVPLIKLHAKIEWKQSGVVRTVKEEGHLLNNAKVMEKLGAAVKRRILAEY